MKASGGFGDPALRRGRAGRDGAFEAAADGLVGRPLMRESQPTLWGHASRVPGRGWRGAVPPVTPNFKTSRRERREVASLRPANGPQGFSRDGHDVASLHPAAKVL